MTILDTLLEKKRLAVTKNKERLSLRDLMAQCSAEGKPPSFKEAIFVPGKVSIIAEMKKASPSAGELVKNYDPVSIAGIYEAGGARALSILTEEEFFKGSIQDLIHVKRNTKLPILRKDFIVDPYQIYESKVIGASAILLIMATLNEAAYFELAKTAIKMEMDVLTEIHNESELEMALRGNPQIIGINNRNLADLSVDLETTFKLYEKVPKAIPVVSESGIQSPDTIRQFKEKGISAALIGETILKSDQPADLLKSFVEAGK